MQLFQLEGGAVVDVVADVFLVGQNRAHRAGIPWPIQIGGHAFLIQAVGDLAEGQIFLDQPAIHLVDPGHFLVRTGHQGNTVGLQRFMFATLQLSLDVAALVHQHAAQAVSSGAALTETQFDQAALPGEDFDRKLPAVFAGHGAFDALDDGRDGRAVILELLGAIGDIDAGTLADVFVIGAFIRILKPAPAAYVINQNDIEVGRA